MIEECHHSAMCIISGSAIRDISAIHDDNLLFQSIFDPNACMYATENVLIEGLARGEAGIQDISLYEF